jgi:hypothetical protein
MLNAGRDIVRGGGPLEAEIIASSILGIWWGRELIEFDVEELVGEAMVAEAGRRRTPESLALLRSLAAVAQGRLGVKAATTANRLADVGVSGPPWLDQVGTAELVGSWRAWDSTGDTTSLIVQFRYGSEPPNVLCALIDRNLGGIVKDAWATTKGGEVLIRYREQCARSDGMYMQEIAPAQARVLLERAFAVTDRAIRHDPPVSAEARSHRALSLARMRQLPEAADQLHPYPEDARFLGRGWDSERANFLAAPEQKALGRPRIVKGCVDAILDYSEFYDDGRLLRVSPTKIEMLLADWLPKWADLSPSQVAVMPELLELWCRHAGAITGHPREVMTEMIATIEKFGPGLAAAAADAEASSYHFLREHVTGSDIWDSADQLQRLAFSLLSILPGFDPAESLVEELSDAVAMAHHEYDMDPPLGDVVVDDHHGVPSSAPHLMAHTMIAEQLWRNDPPEVWHAARRLQLGPYENHEIHHMLMQAFLLEMRPVIAEGKTFDVASYIEALAALPQRKEELGRE